MRNEAAKSDRSPQKRSLHGRTPWTPRIDRLNTARSEYYSVPPGTPSIKNIKL